MTISPTITLHAVLVTDNDALQDVDGLSGLRDVIDAFDVNDGLVLIEGNRSLLNLDGLSQLTRIFGRLSILGNDALTNLDGLSLLTQVGSWVTIANNPSLCRSQAQAFLDACTSCGGSFEISGNDDSC